MNGFKTDDHVVHPEYGRGIVRGKIVGWVEFEGRDMALPDVAADLHRLVTIDTEDREEVERLLVVLSGRGWISHIDRWDTLHPNTRQDLTDGMQAALREYSKHKPEEPTGLGAVVEDADGLRWVRIESRTGWWWRGSAGETCRWSDINAVRRLSEGVPESPEPEGDLR